MTLLQVENLSVAFKTPDGVVNAVNDVSFKLERGKSLGIVGESGSGKSQTVFALMGLLDKNGSAAGRAILEGRDILNLPPAQLNTIRPEKLAMVFQDPMTSLNPYMRISDQMAEVLVHHRSMTKKDAIAQSIRMLDAVRIPEASRRVFMYPHEFSGGMRQRVVIAMALLCEPEVLIADEPTTALDVTVQNQILELLQSLQRDLDMALILITHDLGVVAGTCQDMLVMYGGQVMEFGKTIDLFENPTHPYTQGLLSAIPRLDRASDRLFAIPGSPPNMLSAPKGCPFQPRCIRAIDTCQTQKPTLQTFQDRQRACVIPAEELL